MRTVALRTIMPLAAATLVASSAQAQIQVAVVSNGGNSSAPALAAQLEDDTWADFEATIVAPAAVDSDAELAAYDVVLVGDSGSNDHGWTVAMADAILERVTNDGLGVVGSSWIRYSGSALPSLDAALPVSVIQGFEYCSGPTITITRVADHPIMSGIDAVALPSSLYVEHASSMPDIAGGVVIGRSTSSASCTDVVGNSVVAASLGAGRTVYLGALYHGGVADYDNADLRVGAADRLLEQATLWAAAGCSSDDECSDGDACDGEEACVAGACFEGQPLDCDDGVACTVDACGALTGCSNVPDDASCDDGNACTTDACDAAAGCVAEPADGGSCSAEGLCGDGVCDGGACVGVAGTCDDENPCTVDTCTEGVCAYELADRACDDGNACTSGDTCSDGLCGGTRVPGCCVGDADCDGGTCVDGLCSSGEGGGSTTGEGGGATGAGGGENPGAGGGATSGSGTTSGSGGEGGGDAAEGGDGGCGCDVPGRALPAQPGWLIAAAALLGVRLRRRGRRA